MKEYTKRYCTCSKWEEATNNLWASTQLRETLTHYPNSCPYCHRKLKVRIRKVAVQVSIENELYNDGQFHEVGIPLEELKKLLEEV